MIIIIIIIIVVVLTIIMSAIVIIIKQKQKKIEGHNQGEEIKENSIVLLIKSLQRNN